MTTAVTDYKFIPPRDRIRALESLLCPSRRVLQCPDQAFGIWIDFAHRWPAERGHNTQLLQNCQQGGTP